MSDRLTILAYLSTTRDRCTVRDIALLNKFSEVHAHHVLSCLHLSGYLERITGLDFHLDQYVITALGRGLLKERS